VHVNRRGLVAPTLAVLTVLTLPATAHAGGGNDQRADGGVKGNNITATTKIQTTVKGGTGGTGTGGLTSANTDWTPPACWYEPAFTPKQIQAQVLAFRAIDVGVPFFPVGIGDTVGDMLDGYYKDGTYKNYNLDKQGKGMFWAGVVNPNRKDEPGANACGKAPFWVDEGAVPEEPLAVTPRTLAEYAYDELPVPDTQVTTAPNGKSTVNVPTYVWLDRAKFKPVSVTATLPGTGLSATTTARPVGLTLDAGTDDSTLHPGSGQCPVNADGSIGAPYVRGSAGRTPACGVTYRRASGSATYPLKATLTWEITWNSTNGQGGALPDGTFGGTTDVPVQEVQAVNR
jgi:enoyl reductase